MNQNTKDIAKMLNCDLDVALRIQDAIDEDNLINWSEDSAKYIHNVVMLVARESGLLKMVQTSFKN